MKLRYKASEPQHPSGGWCFEYDIHREDGPALMSTTLKYWVLGHTTVCVTGWK